MNKGISKWPSRVLNLLVVLAMVISLCTILAPAALAQPQLLVEIDNPAEGAVICISQNFTISATVTNDSGEGVNDVYVMLNTTKLGTDATIVEGESPHDIGYLGDNQSVGYEWVVHCDAGGPLDIEVIAGVEGDSESMVNDSVTVNQDPPCLVDLNTYYVDAGKLVRSDDNEYGLGATFYINGAITNPTSEGWTNVTMILSDEAVGAYTSDCSTDKKIEFANASEKYTKDIGVINSKEVGDAWWKVHCCELGNTTVTVEVWGNETINGASVWGLLCDEECTSKSILVTQTGQAIIEIPDVGVTILEPIEASFCLGQVFVVKAEICNLTDYDMSGVNATIDYDHAVLKRLYPIGDYDKIELGALEPIGDTSDCETVGWQMECIATGPTEIKVIGQALDADPGEDSVSVYQADTDAVLDLALSVDKETVCAGCDEIFQITAKVCNLGCHSAQDVWATLYIESGDPNTVHIQEAPGQRIGTLAGYGTQGDCDTVVWNIECLDQGDLTFRVNVTGVDSVTKEQLDEAVKTQNISQVSLVTRIIDPADDITNVCDDGTETVQGKVVSVGQQYYIEAEIKNCADSDRFGVTAAIQLPDSIKLDLSKQVRVQIVKGTGSTETTYQANTEEISISKICSCCKAKVRWPVECIWRTDDPCTECLEGELVIVTATDEVIGGTDTDSDSVTIVQQCKAHLVAGMVAFPGVFSDGTGIYKGDASFQTAKTYVVGKNQKFTVVVPVTNIGQSAAEGVVVQLQYTGNAELTSGSLTQTIGEIPGRSTRKAIYEFECLGAGTVKFDIVDLNGTDANSGWDLAAHGNVDFTCTLYIEQVEASWTVEIINPIEGETKEVSTDFAVKALIWNNGDNPLNDVTATLSWGDDVNASNHEDAELLLHGNGQDEIQTIDQIMPGWFEVVWNMHCTDGTWLGDPPGERLNIKVCATAAGFVQEECDTTYVLQWQPPPPPCEPCVNVTILSPGGDTVLATGQEFLVTARVTNSSGCTAYNVMVDLNNYSLCELVDDIGGDSYHWVVGTVGTSDVFTHSWVLRAVKTGNTECDWGEAYIHVDAYKNSSYLYWCDDDTATPDIAPTANLVVENVKFFDMQYNEITSSKVFVCDEFIVSAEVVNYGEADAWNVMATLSVSPEGSVRIAGGEAGYEKLVEGELGSHLVGWGQEGRGTVEWIVHCKQACESTITITPSGQDECGWHPVFAQDEHHWKAEYEFQSLPGRAIESQFIVPASLTMKQLENGLDLAITKTADKTMAPAEAEVEFAITVTNNGPIAASGINVIDTWTAGALVTPAVISKSQGSLSAFTSTGFTWTVGSLPVNGTATLVYSAVSNSADYIYNKATVMSAEGDGILDNNEFKVELNVASYAIQLDEPWNLVSLPLIPGNTTPSAVITGTLATTKIDKIFAWVYDPDTKIASWKSYSPASESGTLTEIKDGPGYWVKMKLGQTGTLTITGTAYPVPSGSTPPALPAYNVYEGWNLIGFKSTSEMARGAYLIDLQGKFNMVKGYNDSQWPIITSTSMMVPGFGYWIAMNQEGTIYP